MHKAQWHTQPFPKPKCTEHDQNHTTQPPYTASTALTINTSDDTSINTLHERSTQQKSLSAVKCRHHHHHTNSLFLSVCGFYLPSIHCYYLRQTSTNQTQIHVPNQTLKATYVHQFSEMWLCSVGKCAELNIYLHSQLSEQHFGLGLPRDLIC